MTHPELWGACPVKLPSILVLLISSLLACDSINNRSNSRLVDCGETVSEDYVVVLYSCKNRLLPSEFEILLRSGPAQSIRKVTPTGKGCFSRDLLQPSDIMLIKAPKQQEAQVVRPALIQGRTQIVLEPLPEKKPGIVCNYNLVDTTLYLNQFVNFNDAAFLDFYDVSASISSRNQLVARSEQRPLLNAGTYDLRSLVRGQVYDMDLKIHDFVFSDGSAVSTACELDLDIPNLSARLGDAIKEYRNYFGESYGVVEEGYELNFYIEGGLKTVNIDYCLVRLDAEKPIKLQAEAGCADLGLPVKSYINTEKGERFDEGFWLVLYRYKKGLLTKPWTAQKIMVRKVCETAMYKLEQLDQNVCTDLMGNISIEGLGFTGTLEIKYASVLLGQLYVYGSDYQEISLPNLEFASQIDIQSNLALKRLNLPGLSQVSLNFTIGGNFVMDDIRGLAKLERVGSDFNLTQTILPTLAGLEKLRRVGNSLNIQSNSLLKGLNHLHALEFIGGDLTVSDNEALETIEGLNKLTFIGQRLQIYANAVLEKMEFEGKPQIRVDINIASNPNLTSIHGFESNRSLNFLGLMTVGKVTSFKTFRNIAEVGGMSIKDSPGFSTFEAFESLRSIKQGLVVENLPDLKSFDGLQNIALMHELAVRNTGLPDLSGLDNLQSLQTLSLHNNGNLQSLSGLKALSRIDAMLGISGHPKLETLAGTAMIGTQIKMVTIENNARLKDLAILNSLETPGHISIKNNNGLMTLDDLKNVKKFEYSFEISNNMKLETLGNLSQLESIGRDFILNGNAVLKSLSGLPKLSHIGANLDIISNYRLQTLEGLEALKTVAGRITIRYNMKLMSLKGLDGLETVGGGFVVPPSDTLKDPCSFFENPEKLSCRS
jgi:hypothetical protein